MYAGTAFTIRKTRGNRLLSALKPKSAIKGLTFVVVNVRFTIYDVPDPK